MSNLSRFDENVWDRFFDFILPVEDSLTDAEVDAELRRLGIDTKRAFRRVQHAMQAAQARSELEEARAQRPGLLARLTQVAGEITGSIRADLQKAIQQRFQGQAQAALFHKLERAATDEDLRSLIEDMERLKEFSDGTNGHESSAK